MSGQLPRVGPGGAVLSLPPSGKSLLDAQLAALSVEGSPVTELNLQWEAIGPQVTPTILVGV